MKKTSWIIWPVLALGAFLRFWNLGTRPFDGDEGVVLKIADANTLKEVFQGAAGDVHPPLLHFLSYISRHIFGLSEFSARFFPALAGIGSVYFAYLILKKLFDEKVALLGGLFTAISSVLIYSSQETRFYSLLTFFFLGAFYFVLKINGKGTFINWLNFTIFAIGLIYTQHLGLILLLGLLIFLLWGNFRGRIGKLIVTLAGVTLVYLPQFNTTISQVAGRLEEHGTGNSFISNLSGLINAFYRFGAGRIYLDLSPSFSANFAWFKASPQAFILFLLTLLLPIGFFIGGVYLGIRKYRKATVSIYFILLGILLALAISEIGGRASRYLIFLAPFYYGFIAAGIIAVVKNVWGKVLGLLIIAIFCSATVNYFTFTVQAPGGNKIALYLSENAKIDDAVLVRGAYAGGDSFVLNYYWAKVPKPQIIDYFGDYKVGNLEDLKAVNLEEKIGSILDKHGVCWYYDFTYAKDSDVLAEKYQIQAVDLGLDKEKKPIKIWRYSRKL